jgi:hypothetical protein
LPGARRPAPRPQLGPHLVGDHHGWAGWRPKLGVGVVCAAAYGAVAAVRVNSRAEVNWRKERVTVMVQV